MEVLFFLELVPGSVATPRNVTLPNFAAYLLTYFPFLHLFADNGP